MGKLACRIVLLFLAGTQLACERPLAVDPCATLVGHDHLPKGTAQSKVRLCLGEPSAMRTFVYQYRERPLGWGPINRFPRNFDGAEIEEWTYERKDRRIRFWFIGAVGEKRLIDKELTSHRHPLIY